MRLVRLTLAALIAGACASAVDAQNVVFTNSQNTNASGVPYSIPLLSGSTVVVDPTGNLKAQCQLEADGQRCVGIPTGTGGGNPNAPVVSISSTAQDIDGATAGTQVNIGTQFTVTGSGTNTPESCVRSSSPAANGWDGSVLPGLVGTTVSLASTGVNTLKLRCFNGAGAGEATLALTGVQSQVEPPPPPPGDEPAACANIRSQTGASGFTRVTQTSVLNPLTGGSSSRNLSTLRGLYPDGTIGSTLWYFKTSAGQYVAMQFTGDQLDADTEEEGFSPGGQQHSGQHTAAFAYMTISRCQGDFRIRDSNGAQAGVGTGIGYNDPYMACSSELSGGLDNMVNFGWGSVQSTVNGLGSICTIQKDATYYVNIVFADPRVGESQSLGLHPGEIACGGVQTSCGFKYGTM